MGNFAAFASISRAPGSRTVSNHELAERFDDRTPSEIERLTGIRSRPMLSPDESLIDLGATATRDALREADLAPGDLEAVIASTSTAPQLSPGVGCQVLHALECSDAAIPAHDVSAACTGYLYALGAAFDMCQRNPEAHVLVVTAEECTRYLDPDDFDTSVLFADAATATIVAGSAVAAPSAPRLSRPMLSTMPDGGRILGHGKGGDGPVYMDGKRVFSHAVREMGRILGKACEVEGLETRELDVVVPHQANGRIIDAVGSRAGLPADRVMNITATWGNTSSSSIPVALVDLLAVERRAPTQAGLVAFGAGLTSGAALLSLPASGG